MIRFKRTSDTNQIIVGKDLTTQAVLGIMICLGVLEDHGVEMVITALADGKHMTGSLHYEGNAWDIRNRDIPKNERHAIAEKLRDALGEDYDVVGHKSHYHVEYDPKEIIQ